MPDLILCPECFKEKPEQDFGQAKWRRNGLTYRCKACNARRMREWSRKNPDKSKAIRDAAYKKWRADNPLLAKTALVTAEGRFCSTCQNRKSPEAFSKDRNSKDGLSYRCKECTNEYARQWHHAHPYRARLDGKSVDLLEIWIQQDRKCAICRDELTVNGNRRHSVTAARLDHCHKTGTTRGVLCQHCNVGLGAFKDDPVRLALAIAYLARTG